MEEEVVESIPTETTESDDDFFSDVDAEVTEEEIEESEEETSEDSEPSETQEDNSKEDDVDLEPLLKALSGKIKYNKEEVNVESIEELKNLAQKGLNYDKKVQELENLQNSEVITYVSQKAKDLGMSIDEYMNQVKQYEQAQEKQREQDEIEDMINSGIPEEAAKKIVATDQLMKKLQAKENELKEREAQQEKESAKNKEYENFLKQFPDVKPENIPKEVFEDAEELGLINAYLKYQLKETQNKLNIAETNEKNRKASIGSVTETGTTNEKHEKDPFLEGFLEE